MVGGRKTYTYPEGRPRPLFCLEIAMVPVALAWVFLVPGHWFRSIPIILVVMSFAYADDRLHKHYESTGRAVRISRTPRTVVKFPDGLPTAMLGARLAFLLVVAVMLVFGFAPIPELTARHGIIGCVFALIAVALVNVGLEWHYVNLRRGIEVDSSRKPNGASDTIE